ncbi:putative aliphatic sulfonates transport permease protein SsuC [Hartmannibacter diazotrophicus]|uniref:Putative aliphatic sulfonates transport permease protein SsuC n=1 Tax=Hartmannibacter diazotrophicus TaxID=1482074 RepID=A0A2C9D177_9HYPH|nr:ABC transporter permease [Hartmannibacter diazotrophicus]SON53918.1 putative aliphatic sulfonates transport permease protein SsuC [Hartmannibacter diazotrophicus]
MSLLVARPQKAAAAREPVDVRLTLRRYGLPLLPLIALLAFWQYVTVGGHVSNLILASPTAIAAAFFTAGPEIGANMLVTLMEALVGFVLGNLLGLVIAIVFVHSSLARRMIYPVAVGAEAVPFIAILPVLILWLGNGVEPKIVITTFIAYFPMLVNALRGLRSADAEVNELLYTLSASAMQRLFIVRLPAAIPFMFNALKLSACGTVVTALVAEWLASDRGLGYLIVLYGTRYQIPELWASALTAMAMSLLVYGAVVLAEQRLMPWRRNAPAG